MQAMSDERLEELRQIAGGLAGEPKSDWMDELIREIDRLRTRTAGLEAAIEAMHEGTIREAEKAKGDPK